MIKQLLQIKHLMLRPMKKHSLTNPLKKSILILFALFSFTLANAQDFYTSKIISCAAGYDHTLAIDSSGYLWVWGSNEYGKLGDGSKNIKSVPTMILKNNKFKSVAAGQKHSLAIDTSGTIWAWGYDYEGQVDGFRKAYSIVWPVQVKPMQKFIAISAGYDHSLAIDESGNLWSWGGNSKGQAGIGKLSDVSYPTIINEGTKFKTISAGNFISKAIDENGHLWEWGSGLSGIGNVTLPVMINNGIKYLQVSADGVTMAIDEKGNLWGWGNYIPLCNGKRETWLTPTQLTSDIIFSKISWKDNHLLAIDENGNLFVCGNNGSGELGFGNEKENLFLTQIMIGKKISWVSSGSSYSLIIEDSSYLWVFGRNNSSQLGDGKVKNRRIPFLLNTTNIAVEEISISLESVVIRKDSVFQLATVVLPSNATDSRILWSTSDSTIVAVDSLGQVTGIKFGSATITATTVDGIITASCIVTVVSQVTSLSLSAETLSIQKGSAYKLTAMVLPLDATNDTVNWSSSDETIATVDSTGLVTGVRMGTVTITATTADGGITATCEVAVLAGLSVQIFENGTQLMVYPNPLKDGQLNIRLKEHTNDAELTIFNANGQLVYSDLMPKGEAVQVDYKIFEPGLFLIKVSNNEISELRKILVE